MSNDSNRRPTGRWALALALLVAAAACSRETAAPREIRAHDRILGGVSHASPAGKPLRYCQGCHGVALAGGDERFVAAAGDGGVKPPSCFTCHGKRWTNDEASAAATPPTHTQVMTWPGEAATTGSGSALATADDAAPLAFRHHPGLFDPETACVSCHGQSLEGDDPEVGGTRSGCNLCHGDLWNERAPGANLHTRGTSP
jgi:hypothetical protein